MEVTSSRSQLLFHGALGANVSISIHLKLETLSSEMQFFILVQRFAIAPRSHWGCVREEAIQRPVIGKRREKKIDQSSVRREHLPEVKQYWHNFVNGLSSGTLQSIRTHTGKKRTARLMGLLSLTRVYFFFVIPAHIMESALGLFAG